MILLLYKKYKNGDFLNTDSNTNSVKLLKRSEKISNNKLLHQLCLIPGVSQKVAESVILYPINSIKHLIDVYNNIPNESDRELLFSDVIIQSTQSTSKKPRKIGKALSKKIYEYVYK